MDKLLKTIFIQLNKLILKENKNRMDDGTLLVPKSQIIILGQSSLLSQPALTAFLSLAQTGDLDALLRADSFVKKQLELLLSKHGLIYDEDSPLIFVPKNSRFTLFLDLPLLEVKIIDPESALVSKAVKAPEKNKQLIRQAIASEEYSALVDRIIENGGKLKNFV